MSETETVATAKASKLHKCAKCGKEFEGSGKRGRPFKLCPKCRAEAAAAKKA